MDIVSILIVILLLIVLGVLPVWPHSTDWGYLPSGSAGLLLLILIIVLRLLDIKNHPLIMILYDLEVIRP